MNLADVLREADPNEEPCRDQLALLDGETTVVMLCCLYRTAVIKVGEDRVLVPATRLDVDPNQFRWQKRSQATPRQSWRRMRKARSEAGG